MNFQPQTLYISVIDLFFIFIPGAITTIVIYHNFTDLIENTFVIDPNSSNYTWALVLLYAFISGHVIDRIGSKFDDWLYDRWRKKKPPYLLKEVKRIIEKDNDKKQIDSTFKRVKYRILESGSPMIQKIDKEMAGSKFFRSLFVICIGLIILYFYKFVFTEEININWWLHLFLVILLGIFSCMNYFKSRLKSNETAYEYFIYQHTAKYPNISKNIEEFKITYLKKDYD